MAQIVIDGVLFSPVLAHSLEPGDLVRGVHEVYRLTSGARPDGAGLRADATALDGTRTYLKFWTNEPVYRAVGARAGRGGAR